MFADAVQALVRILALELTLQGYTMSLGELLLYFGFGAILCFIVGGLLK